MLGRSFGRGAGARETRGTSIATTCRESISFSFLTCIITRRLVYLYTFSWHLRGQDFILKDATPDGGTNCIAQAKEPPLQFFSLLFVDGHSRIAGGGCTCTILHHERVFWHCCREIFACPGVKWPSAQRGGTCTRAATTAHILAALPPAGLSTPTGVLTTILHRRIIIYWSGSSQRLINQVDIPLITMPPLCFTALFFHHSSFPT